MFTDEEKRELESAGEDYARDYMSWNTDKSEEDLRQELEGCAPDLALSWSKDGTHDARCEAAADYIFEGMLRTLREKFSTQ